MDWKEEPLLASVAGQDTDELLDQITAYRMGMEPAAITIIERELRRRGINANQIAVRQAECEETCLFQRDGVAKMCSFCRKPAIKEGWGWHKIMGVVPIIPRWLRYCVEHAINKRPGEGKHP